MTTINTEIQKGLTFVNKASHILMYGNRDTEFFDLAIIKTKILDYSKRNENFTVSQLIEDINEDPSLVLKAIKELIKTKKLRER